MCSQIQSNERDALFVTGFHQCVMFLKKLFPVILTYESLVTSALVMLNISLIICHLLLTF